MMPIVAAGARASSRGLSPSASAFGKDNLLLFFTGFSRSASQILKDQDQRIKGHDTAMIDNLHYVKDLLGKLVEQLLAKIGVQVYETGGPGVRLSEPKRQTAPTR
jgi:hypothetical protein